MKYLPVDMDLDDLAVRALSNYRCAVTTARLRLAVSWLRRPYAQKDARSLAQAIILHID